MGMNLEPNGNEPELGARRELFAVLAHEFRSPIGAILGFEELLSENIFGELPEPARDALARVRSSAYQLLDLVAGLNDLAGSSGEPPLLDYETLPAAELLAGVVEAVQHDAAGRDARLELSAEPDLPALDTDPERCRRALRLALLAGVKSSAGMTVRLEASAADGALLLQLQGTHLDAARDDPELSLASDDGPRLTGAGLRIAMARDALAPLHGAITLAAAAGEVTLSITLPTRPARD